MTKYLAGIIFFILSATSVASESATNKIQGAWQSSFAYNGKTPWNHGTLIINKSHILFEKEGREINRHSYSILFSENNFIAVKTDDDSQKQIIYLLAINPKFKCQPQSPLHYDNNCTGHDTDSPFQLLTCESVEMAKTAKSSCTSVDKYFKFEDRQLFKLGELSENL